MSLRDWSSDVGPAGLRAGRMNRGHPLPRGKSQIAQPAEARMAVGIEYASKDAKPGDRFGNRRLDAIFVCDIAGDPDGARKISRGGPCLAAVKIDDGNAASFRREAARRGDRKSTRLNSSH